MLRWTDPQATPQARHLRHRAFDAVCRPRVGQVDQEGTNVQGEQPIEE